jgi:hypothetical protein
MHKGGLMNLTTTQNLNDIYKVYKDTHEQKPHFFRGYSIVVYLPEIARLIQVSNIKTVIDYGCGKAEAWEHYKLKQMLNLDEVVLFDPGVEKYALKPKIQSDMVICVDVMEHVPEHLVDEVIDDICNYSKKVVFFGISTRSSSKALTNGTNAHPTVKPEKWWRNKFAKYDQHLLISHFSS